ncbi:MAG: hypothetical protein AB1899_08950 [Pseudomonadota bacterium]
METYQDIQGVQQHERRHHPQLRAIYDDAWQRIDHFFHAHTDWANSPIDYLAHRVVHEAYPGLSTQDVRLLVAAIERRYQSSKDAALH